MNFPDLRIGCKFKRSKTAKDTFIKQSDHSYTYADKDGPVLIPMFALRVIVTELPHAEDEAKAAT